MLDSVYYWWLKASEISTSLSKVNRPCKELILNSAILDATHESTLKHVIKGTIKVTIPC